MTPDREIRALARALGCERREVVQALEAAELLKAERRPAPKLQRQAAPFRLGAAKPVEKDLPVRSEAYRQLVAARPCIHCGIHGHSQCAHENRGKGLGLKVDDRRSMPLCTVTGNDCHGRFDTYTLLPGGREAHAAAGRRWSAKTRAAIQAEGLWPAGLPQLEEPT